MNDLQHVPSLAHLAKASAHKFGKKPAVTMVLSNGMNGSLNYEQVDSLSDDFAVYLREVLKVPRGTVVAVQMPNCLSYPIAVLGIFKAGLVLVNVNPLYTVPEMIHQLNDSEAQVLVTVNLYRDKAAIMLDKTKIQRVVVASLVDCLPLMPKIISELVIKYWNKQIPADAGPSVSMKAALKEGRARRVELKIKTESYFNDLVSDSMAVLQYTGGTTGISKGAILTHGNILANMRQLFVFLAPRLKEGEECVLTALPLYHIFAFTVNFMCFYAIGARNLLIPNPRPISHLQRAFENYPVSVLSGVNTLYNALNSEEWFRDTPPSKLKMAVAGGMSLHSKVAEDFKRITGLEIIEGYGLTETSPAVSFNPFEAPKPGSIGKPVPLTEVRLVDDQGLDVPIGQPGELWIKGPQVMRGYWKNPTETGKVLRDGWFATGDIAVSDSEGYLRIVDRKKDMILVSGFNVYPNEVEDALTQHPAIQEAAVIGIADGPAGEAVKAFVVMREGMVSQPEDLRAHCKGLLVAYKVPKYFEVRSELPKSNVGKILRKELRSEALSEKGSKA
ncbi:MAG: AMP-binding protein [Proteobacteria bacterium]|jgi:long-chain acyl-CoA synthetase|nr:AMP-binding protein [Pseudomonadota bacterium]